MRLDQLQYIIEIHDSGSISVAAERLHVSQPTISQSVISLEKELNTKIFNRTRMGVHPTEPGKLIIEKSREIMNKVNDLNNIAKSQSTVIEGSISVSSVPSMCMALIPKTLGSFKNYYPQVDIEVSEMGSKLVMQQVLEGKVDLGLISIRDNKLEEDNKVIFEPMLVSKVLLCVGKDSPLANKKEVSLNEIISYPIVSFNSKYNMNTYMFSLLEKHGKPNILITSENSEATKKVIVENLAVGFYTDISLKNDPYITSGQILPIKIKECKNSYSTLGILYKKNSHLPIAVKKLIEELRIHAKLFRKQYNISEIG
jgi:DNA-binding transcriptional LysR family regulator